MLKSPDLYIDLGTANTIIYGSKRGFLLNEPSVLAMKRTSAGKKDLFGLGGSAKQMIGRNPENISIVKPLSEGVISDSESTARMLASFLRKIKTSLFLLKPRMIISLPCRVTEYERNAVKEVGLSLGGRIVHLLDEPMAAAVGSGLSVLSHKGSMVVDIGGGTSEIAVISLGGIISSAAVRVGSDRIDQLIIEHLRNRYNFRIGEQTAEYLKINIADVGPNVELKGLTCEVGGFDCQKGLPRKVNVNSAMIYEPVNSVVKEIISAIKRTLEVVPPEVSGDIAENGMVLAGGGALLNGLRERLIFETGIPVRVAQDPLLSVACGGAEALENRKLFEAIARTA